MLFPYVPLLLVVFVVAAVIAVVIVFTSHLETPPGYYTAYSSYLGFVVAVTWIYLISNEAVSAIRVRTQARHWLSFFLSVPNDLSPLNSFLD